MNRTIKQFLQRTTPAGLMLAAMSLLSCNEPTPGTETEQDVISSQRQWEAQKATHASSYAYTV